MMNSDASLTLSSHPPCHRCSGIKLIKCDIIYILDYIILYPADWMFVPMVPFFFHHLLESELGDKESFVALILVFVSSQ